MTCLTTIGFYWLDEDCGTRYINMIFSSDILQFEHHANKTAFQIQLEISGQRFKENSI